MKRTIRIKDVCKCTLISKHSSKKLAGAPVYLKDIARIIDTVKETESYHASMENVVTLNIIKRSGET